MLELRQYQQQSLDKLERYLISVAEHGARTAFVLETGRPYLTVPQLPGLPYVCLRIPTGGGKTLMACHALGIAARALLQADRAVCLWLVPSNTILEQTLLALRDREHPYRQAIDARFAGQVRVMDLTEALYVQRGVLEGDAVIIVSTLQALRVEDTDGRKVYEEAGALQHHFEHLVAELAASLEKREDGSIIRSLANVLRLRRPVVIMDEAHNARTELSFDTLARFNPSCIIEFTATPETRHAPEARHFASNVLGHVSAAELKAEEMVKLPIKLQTNADWRQTVGEACAMQRTLEEVARMEESETGEYLRPIVLLQAQPRSQVRSTLTVEVVKRSLLDDFKIPEDQIAIATGETREIDDVDLFDRSCPIRFIITKQALKEGWDCAFAYVLCSIADVGSHRAVEQILGRVLRLPHARWKRHPELNCAYAFAASPQFIEAANALKDALVQNGFQRMEASDLVVPAAEQRSLFEPGTLFAQASQAVSEAPDLSNLEPLLRERVAYDQHTGQLTVAGVITEQQTQAIQDCFNNPEDRVAVERICRALRGQAAGAAPPGAVKEVFNVPFLAIRVGKQLEILEESHFLDTEWNLADCDPRLPQADFPLNDEAGELGEVDVDDAGRIDVRFVQRVHAQLALLADEPGWTQVTLANWLDHEITHPDIPQSSSSLFMHNTLTYLIQQRGFTLNQLARRKFRLRAAIAAKIAQHRRTHADSAFRTLAFGPLAVSLEVDPQLCFSYDEDRYAPNWLYDGPFQFKKHYFRRIGELRSDGEEFECAVFVDGLRDVKFWVRNLQRPDSSFWLQTSSDRFYPDFVAKLHDGRILVVESKGEHLWSNDDSREKRAVGELWAERSGGRCLFVMPKGTDWSSIAACLERSGDWGRPEFTGGTE